MPVDVDEEHGLHVLEGDVEVDDVAGQDRDRQAEDRVGEALRGSSRHECEQRIGRKHEEQILGDTEARGTDRGGSRRGVVIEFEKRREVKPTQEVERRQQGGRCEQERARQRRARGPSRRPGSRSPAVGVFSNGTHPPSESGCDPNGSDRSCGRFSD